MHVNYLNVPKKTLSLLGMQGHFRFFAMVFFNSHAGLGVIWYFNIYKLILNCKGWWRVHNTHQQEGAARALWVVRAASTHRRIPPPRAAFDAPHHHYHVGEAHVLWRHSEELRQGVFLFLPLFPLSI
jgi:hypothetical protein